MTVAMHFPSRTHVATAATSTPLPSSSVAMLPGNYTFNGGGYNCTAPGLYKFWAGNNTPIQSRFVFGRLADGITPDPESIYSFMAALSCHHVHGVADETTNWYALATGGMTSKWELTCGYISGLAKWWVPQYGLPARVVTAVTVGPLNGVDDGHTVIEVSHGGKWKMWDLTNGLYFTKDGVHLSTAEVIAAGILTCVRVPLGTLDKMNSAMAGSFDMGSYSDMTRQTPDEIDAWFARIFQSWSITG